METDAARFVRQPINGERRGRSSPSSSSTSCYRRCPPARTPPRRGRWGGRWSSPTARAVLALADAIRAHGRVALVPAHDGPPATAPLVGLGVAAGDTAAYVSLDHHGLGARRLSRDDAAGGAAARCSRTRACAKDAHDAKALALLLLGVGHRARRGSTRTSSCSPTCSTPRAGSTRWRTSRASGSTSSCRSPTTRRRRAGPGAASRTGLPRSVAEAFGQRAAGGGAARPGAVAGHRVGQADRARPRARAAAGAGAGPDGAGTACKVDLGASSRSSRATWTRQCAAQEQELHRLAGRVFNVNSNAAAGAGALHRPQAAGAEEGQDRPVDRRRGAGEAGREAPAAARAARVPDAQQAEDAPTSTRWSRWSAPTAGCTPPSTRRRRRPGGSPARTRTSRTSRCAPSRAKPSAGPSSPSRAGS